MRARTSLLFALLLACAGSTLAAQQASYDLIIRNGRVMDGSGNPWFAADIGIRGDRIVSMGRLNGAHAARVIDATGRYVVPGFIDIHSHADDNTGGVARYLRSEDARRRAALWRGCSGCWWCCLRPCGSRSFSPPWPRASRCRGRRSSRWIWPLPSR